MGASKIRRYDLDWLRVLVFGLLIIYHVGMFFVPWGWHLKNNMSFDWLRWPMLFVNQWRLPILFVISGMGTSFALSYRSGRLFAWERVKRLGIPLLFGMFFIIPPQVYIERLVQKQYSGSYLDFLISGAFVNGIYPSGNFSWHHLWFLPYLLIFSLILIPAFLYLRNHPHSIVIKKTKSLLHQGFGIYFVVLPLWFVEVLVEPFFDETHALIGDWFALSYYILFFFIGFLFIRCQTAFWNAIDKIKAKSLVLGIICFCLLVIRWNYIEDGLIIHIMEALIKIVNIWSWVFVLFGYAAKYLNQKSALLLYCNTAVYPFYILHQTVQVILCYFIMDENWGLGIKSFILILGTFLISWILYEGLIRRINVLRPLFGIKGKYQPK